MYRGKNWLKISNLSFLNRNHVAELLAWFVAANPIAVLSIITLIAAHRVKCSQIFYRFLISFMYFYYPIQIQSRRLICLKYVMLDKSGNVNL